MRPCTSSRQVSGPLAQSSILRYAAIQTQILAINTSAVTVAQVLGKKNVSYTLMSSSVYTLSLRGTQDLIPGGVRKLVVAASGRTLQLAPSALGRPRRTPGFWPFSGDYGVRGSVEDVPVAEIHVAKG